MKTVTKNILHVVALAAALSIVGGAEGCAHKNKTKTTKPAKTSAKAAKAKQTKPPEVTDIDIVDAVRDSGVKAAIISQHTLFPYHFESEGDMLNALGERDLAVLSAHLRVHPGQINIPRGSMDAKIYDARIAHVNEALHAAGVNAGNVKIVDAMGGTNMNTPSEDVIRDLRNSRTRGMQQQQQQQNGSNGSGSATMMQAPSTGAGSM
jgi:hypothetical protein